MVSVNKARKLLGTKYEGLDEDTIYNLIGLMLMFAKIDYQNNTK
jgi:hypothetical protein